jgi:hypothetical protein
MIVMSFDLSSSCIGLVVAEIKPSGKISKMRSCPIIPQPFSAETLGYMKSKKKVELRDGNSIMSYMRPGESKISKAEKKRRDMEVRASKNIAVLQNISRTMNDLVSSIRPDLIIVEKNEIFNGVLTSVLLGEVMGTLVSISGIHSIPLNEFRVSQVRTVFNISELIKALKSRYSEDFIEHLPDVTKRAIRDHLADVYKDTGVTFQTDDESDACAVFHYWYTKIR